MVQFSEILRKKEKKPHSEPPQNHTREEKVSMSSIRRADEAIKLSGVDPQSTVRHNENIKTYYEQLLERARDVRDRVKAKQGIPASPILSILHNITIEDLIDPLYEYAVLYTKDSDLPSHSVCVTVACMKLAKGMRYETKEILRLGLTAFLGDVGMYLIPDAILNQEGKLDPRSLAVIRNHPEVSAQVISQMGEAFHWMARLALQLHERSDGSGYPKGLRGDEISEFASIIGLVDIYMAMIRNRPYRKKYMETEAVKSVIGLVKGQFPNKIVKDFLVEISLFPVNSYVRLNNKAIGRVLSTDKNHPLKPVIELLYDGVGQKMKREKIVHLSDSPLLRIVDTVGEEELP